MEVILRENHLKGESIDNLEKIVNELTRKNQLAELGAGPIEQEIRRNEEVESKRQIVLLEKELADARGALEGKLVHIS